MSKLFLIIGATVVVLGGINAKAEERPAFERFGFPITQTQVAVLGSAGVRERSPTPALMQRNAGVPASGDGSIAAPAQREGNGSELVNYWFGAPSSDAPLNCKFAIGIPACCAR